ncbi:protein ABHD11-like isoform X2 [Diorhabda sublineata]|uniref:protein ABHD11-like isoform X2 n=1 Tax=Diorhabda sublineata TaxID=1163346 RepID=UPI0024E15C5D|nr:protein ABHD11-like isoform X2 [Diorhabda sublineata]
MFAIKNQNNFSRFFFSIYAKTESIISRCISSTETLEPIDMSYATYESTGNEIVQSNPFIIVHGLFGSKSNWNSICKYYNQKFNPSRKIIAVDTRNHGDSPHSDKHTYAHLAADIKSLYGQLNIQKAVLMGHSMGGRAVMLFALKYPELVERLIVADISPISDSPNMHTLPNLFKIMENIKLPSNIPMSQCRSQVDMELSKSIEDKGLRDFLLTNLVEKNKGSFHWRINIHGLLANFNCVTRFPIVNDLQYEGPTLFLAGGKSDFVPKNLDLAYNSYETTSYLPEDSKPIPLVVLHGFLASKNNWNTMCKKIHHSSKSKVIAIDARNHGDSPHSKEHTYDCLATDLKRFLEKMELKKVNLLGHSMGGRTAMLFALKYPDLVERLIVADVSPVSTSDSTKIIPNVLSSLKRIHIPSNKSLREAKKIIGENLYNVIRHKLMLALLLTNLVQKSDGRKSDFPRILKLFPNAELKYIEGAGHWLHSEKPAEFLSITLEFLNRRFDATQLKSSTSN